MNIIENMSYDEERALYGIKHARLIRCSFTGPKDGESAVKECSDIIADHCYCNLRYPFWHVHQLKIQHCEMTEKCRAALWYSDHIEITESAMHGIKALRECHDVLIQNCTISSNEFGWFSSDIRMDSCAVESEYFMLHTENAQFFDVRIKGKYILQYIRNCTFDNCVITSRDAFWHARNVVVKNSVLHGEFLGWYSNHLTLENCKIVSSQPLCYCANLRLINCELVDSDLCFEKSDVDAVITTPVDSIKNPRSGRIVVPSVKEIIRDDADSTADIVTAS